MHIISVMAAASIANIVKSSLGPVGLDKMLVDDIGVSRFMSHLRATVIVLGRIKVSGWPNGYHSLLEITRSRVIIPLEAEFISLL